MSRQITKNKLMDLITGHPKAEDRIIICFDDNQTPDVKSNDTFIRIVFRDFQKEREMTCRAHCKQQ